MTILPVLLMMLTTGDAAGAYRVHHTAGKVSVVRNGQAVPLEKGMEVSANELIELGEGSRLEILNTGDSRIYSSTKSGKRSVSSFIFSAKAEAGANAENVNRQINGGGALPKRKLNTETGVVTRRQMDADSVALMSDTLLPEIAYGIAEGCGGAENCGGEVMEITESGDTVIVRYRCCPACPCGCQEQKQARGLINGEGENCGAEQNSEQITNEKK